MTHDSNLGATMAELRLEHIDKRFDATRVLNSVDLAIAPGEFLTLVGPSGCGKSTLLRILAGLEAPTAGQVVIGGQDVTQTRPSQRNLAMVFQNYALYPHLSVAENMLTPLKLRDLNAVERLPVVGPLLSRAKRAELAGQVQTVAETLQVTQLLDRKPGQLSGGQRQRVALGRAMVRRPVAFLMDEPLSNLDAALRVHMRAELTELHRRLGTTFVYVTHDQAEALTMSTRVAVMMDGDLLQVGTPDAVYADPDCLKVASFIGSPKINVLPGEIDASGYVALLGQKIDLKAVAPGPVQVGIRPEHLQLVGGDDALTTGTVAYRENLGSDVYLHVNIDDATYRVIVRATPAQAVGLTLGATVTIGFNAQAALLFDSDGMRVKATSSVSGTVAA
ncbi:ABC transporter ATP-binding protein [Yoonia sp. GPGPB17]|uniref:ABC transporter ATP-binding protein n=1 Tax=Yoonia sp. GPGPB17 TaxID=3026147 RepID=UPI0030EB4D56